MKTRSKNKNKFKPKVKRSPLSFRIDPTKTSKLRRELSNHLKEKFNSLKKKLVDLIVLEDAFGLKPYLLNSNPDGCNQYTGKDCSGSNEENKKDPDKTKLQKITDKLKSAGAKAKHIEEAVSSYVKDKVSTNIAKLPKPIQKVVNAGVIAGKVITKTAFVTWISGQALAEQVAKEKGRTEEEAKKLKSTLQALDIAAYKPAQIVSIIGLGPAAAFTSMIPPATSIYLAYSTARNPLATVRAAKTLVKNLISSFKKKPKEEPPTTNADQSQVELLDTYLKEMNYDDWFIAILVETINEMQGSSLNEILATAKSIYEQNPKDNSSLREDDLDYFGKDLTTNRRWSLKRNPDKLRAFQDWLSQQIGLTLTSQNEEELWKRFALEGMKKGAARSFDDVKKSAKKKKVYKDWKLQQEYYNGTKEQFLMDSFVQPVATEKLQLLAMRSFDDLWNITDDMSTRMSRTLLDGLATGSSPREIARDLASDVDISRDRALTVARTEIVRAHADGQLLALKGLGIEELGVAVEWITTGDEKVCKACQPLEGIVLKLEEAEGLLPRHPNCVTGEMVIASPDILAIMRSKYTGIIHDLITSDGHSISITPNHIMLTQRGWVFAKDLTDTDYLINCVDIHSPVKNPQKNNRESRISNIFNSLMQVLDKSFITKSLPMGHYFHGDGKFINSEIDIISTYGILRSNFEPSLLTEVVKSFLHFTNITVRNSLGLNSKSSFSSFLERSGSTSDRLLSIQGIPSMLLARSLTHHQPISLNYTPNVNSIVNKDSSYSSSIYRKILTNPLNTESLMIQLNNLFRGKLTRVKRNIPRHVSNLDVFDASTKSTLYTINGVICSNCRCAWVPANVGEDNEDQVSSRGDIKSALEESQEELGGSGWKVPKISRSRPEPILNRMLADYKSRYAPEVEVVESSIVKTLK